MPVAGCLAKPAPSRRPGVRPPLDALSAESNHPLRHWDNGVVSFSHCCKAHFFHIHTATGGLAALFEGRLDNRHELAREHAANPEASVAELLLAAYRKWGIDFLDRVVGDFYCAVWDGAQGRLLLGRDCLGRMPLVYHDAPGAFHFASDTRTLQAITGISRDINEETLARWFARQARPLTHTFHRGISRVPPGHVLIVSSEGLRLHRYWRPEDKPLLRLSRDEEYGEAVLEALEEAVNCRLPAEGLVACSLSAGLDSPSVASLAARQLAKQGRTLIAFTAVPQPGFNHPGHYPERLCDEGLLAASVARRYSNIDHVLIPNNSHPLLAAMENGIRTAESPLVGSINVSWFAAMHEEARRHGAVTFLTGQAGNFTISYNGMLLLTSLLVRGRLPSLGREILGLRRAGASWGHLGMSAIGPLLPPRLRTAIRQSLGKEAESNLYDYSCINPRFARENGMEERFSSHDRFPQPTPCTDGRTLRLHMLQRLDAGIAITGNQRRYGFSTCDPTADKRLIELCLSIPEDQYLRHGDSRSLIRRAMRGILPEEIRNNRRIGLQSADWAMTLTAQVPDILAELQRLDASPLAQRYLDLPRMRMLVEALPHANWQRNTVRMTYDGLVRSLAAGIFIRITEEGAGP